MVNKKYYSVLFLGFLGLGTALVIAYIVFQQKLLGFYDQGIQEFENGKDDQAIASFDSALSSRLPIISSQEVGNTFYFKCLAHYRLKNYLAASEDCTQAIETLADPIPNIGLILAIDPTSSSVIIQGLQGNTPAVGNRALKNGDKITEIGSKKVTEIGLTQSIEEVSKGNVGSEVKLTVVSEDGKKLEHTLTRILLPNKRKELAYYYRGLANTNNEQHPDYRSAILDFDAVIKRNPEFAEYYLRRGISKSKAKQKQEALVDLVQAIKLNPKLPQAHYELGIIHRDRGTPELRQQAIRDFKSELSINPGYIKAYQELGGVQDDSGDKQGAINTYSLVIESVKKNRIKIEPFDKMNFYLSRAKAFSNLMRKNEALADYQQVLQEAANSSLFMAQAYNGIAVIKEQSGDMEGAFTAYSEAIKMDERDPIPYFDRGKFLFEFKKDYG
jgi:tetratricopeptide (TPR) repeat protein